MCMRIQRLSFHVWERWVYAENVRLCVCHLAEQLLTTSCSTQRRQRKVLVRLSRLTSMPGTESSLKSKPRSRMQVQMWMAGLLVLASGVHPAEALSIYDPRLCYILDGFLGLYGLIVTGMFIREKFFRTRGKAADNGIYSDLVGQDGDYAPLRRDPESGGRSRWTDDNSTYTPLQKSGVDEYKELPVKRERQRKNEQVYQGLSSATRDTYQSLQMQPLPAR